MKALDADVLHQLEVDLAVAGVRRRARAAPSGDGRCPARAARIRWPANRAKGLTVHALTCWSKLPVGTPVMPPPPARFARLAGVPPLALQREVAGAAGARAKWLGWKVRPFEDGGIKTRCRHRGDTPAESVRLIRSLHGASSPFVVVCVASPADLAPGPVASCASTGEWTTSPWATPGTGTGQTRAAIRSTAAGRVELGEQAGLPLPVNRAGAERHIASRGASDTAGESRPVPRFCRSDLPDPRGPATL